ncbi:hypothetical protein [Polaribacter sp.]|uniref:hypothetical protein n=1 Tax=Polaribacter sp. TaxID=1920175 RepID=UPI003F6B9646
MNKELAKQSLKLFDTPEKWNTFIEINRLKDEMRNQIFLITKNRLVNYFNSNPVDEWSFKSFGHCNWDYRWFLTDYKENSVGIWMNGVQVGFYYEGEKKEKVLELFNSKKFSDLKKCFRPDNDNNNTLFYCEYGNFKFDSPDDENFDLDSIAGYLLNKPNEYISQVIQKIDNVRKNTEFLKLIKSLNQELNEL